MKVQETLNLLFSLKLKHLNLYFTSNKDQSFKFRANIARRKIVCFFSYLLLVRIHVFSSLQIFSLGKSDISKATDQAKKIVMDIKSNGREVDVKTES